MDVCAALMAHLLLLPSMFCAMYMSRMENRSDCDSRSEELVMASK